MSGIYIPEDKVPTKCIGCTFRDPEYGGACVLMPFSEKFNTYEEQFERCPFKEIRNAARKYVSQRSEAKEGRGMRCAVKNCMENEDGYCCASSYISIDEHGECDSMLIISKDDEGEE